MSKIFLNLQAILFDMDGTLVDSTAGVEGAWELFRKSYPHIDINLILSSAHGVRTVDNLKQHCGIDDPEILEKEAERFEQAIVTTASEGGRPGILLLPGAKDVMNEIAELRHLPKPSWAICTSATRVYATSALKQTSIPIPDVFVTSEEVLQGKPFPDPYLLGAQRCGLKPEQCIVFEDAPSGVRSGKAAGCVTVALLTTHSREQLEAANPDYIIKDLTSITLKKLDTGIEITLQPAL